MWGGWKRRIFIFQPISSCDMSRGRFFGVLNSKLEEFFGSHPPGGVHGGGRGGERGERGDFYFPSISSCQMSRGRFFGVLNSNLEEFFGLHPPGGVHCGWGGEGGKEGDFFLSW